MNKKEIEKILKEKNIEYINLWLHPNGDYTYENYKDKCYTQHLIRDGKEIASGISAFSLNNWLYFVEWIDGTGHLMLNNNKEIFSSGRLYLIYQSETECIFKDENGVIHKFNEKGEKIEYGNNYN